MAPTIEATQETFVKANRIFVDGKRIIVTLNGEIEEIEAIKIKKAILEILATFKNKAELIIDFKSARTMAVETTETLFSLKEMKQIANLHSIGIKKTFGIPHYFLQNIKKGFGYF